MCSRSDPAVEQLWTSLPTGLLDHLELSVVDGVANVSVDSGSVDLVSIDLSASELRDEHRRVNGAFLSGEVAELFQETSVPGGTVLREVVTFAFSAFPFSGLSFAAAFFASTGCFFIAILL